MARGSGGRAPAEPEPRRRHAFIAWCLEICYARGGRDEAHKIAGLRDARTANASETDDATALAVAAFAMGMLSKDYKAAVSVFERALSLNPSCAERTIVRANLRTTFNHSGGARAT